MLCAQGSWQREGQIEELGPSELQVRYGYQSGTIYCLQWTVPRTRAQQGKKLLIHVDLTIDLNIRIFSTTLFLMPGTEPVLPALGSNAAPKNLLQPKLPSSPSLPKYPDPLYIATLRLLRRYWRKSSRRI